VTEAQNLLFIFSDEHSRDITGAYGNPHVKTPNLDAMAAAGTRFANPYVNCPICVPSRASLATGRYVHAIRSWDNAHPYAGDPPGWGQALIDQGHEVTAIGKLHYRSEQDPVGFSEHIETLNVVDGIGDLLGMIRRPPAERGNVKDLAAEAGRGESTYTQYDRRICAHAEGWLERKAERPTDKPWMLFVGFVLPHFPLVAPEEFYDLYDPKSLPWPKLAGTHERPDHPVLNALRGCMNYADYFDEERIRTAVTAYYGMVSFLDHHIGRLVRKLEETGLAANTRIIYTSDHGDNLGDRGFWGKSVMYDESTAVPLLMTGKDIARGKVVETPVSLVDLTPTFMEAMGAEPLAADLPGRSLFAIAAEPDDPGRAVFSEYHAVGSITGMFMLRKGKWKLIHYEGHRPQLFDLESDPDEADDRAADPACAPVLADLEAELRKICDPAAVTAQAFADQAARIAAHGGAAAIKARGDFGYTPAPGQTPVFG
jgi:choline-sulfatase